MPICGKFRAAVNSVGVEGSVWLSRNLRGTAMRIDRYTLLRWLISASLAAVAAWSLIASLVAAVRSRSDGWFTIAFISVFALLFAAPFALAAYFCFKRRYGDLFMVSAAVGAFFLLSLCFTVPRHLDAFETMHNWKGREPWQPFVMLALTLLLLVGPFYLVGWLLRVCSRFAARRLPNGPAPRDT